MKNRLDQLITVIAFCAVLGIMAALFVVLRLIPERINATEKAKNRVLIAAALLIDGFELFKIVLMCFRSHDPMTWLYELPLFLCSIQLITIPLAAFSKGRIKEAATASTVCFRFFAFLPLFIRI